MKLTKHDGKTVTMTSLEMVDYINSMRSDGDAELRHADFLAKVPKVLGDALSETFRSAYKDSTGRKLPMYTFPKREACLMAMSYSYDLQAKVFDRMTALEEQTLKLGAGNTAMLWSKRDIDAARAFILGAAKDLKLAQSSVLGMYQKLEQKAGLSGFLPHYAVDAPASTGGESSETTKPIGTLLEEHSVGMSAIAFNRLLIQAGFLKEEERQSSRGTSKFKVITDLEYGKNLTSPNNPRETQPHWYVCKFPELLELIMPAKPEAVA